MPACRCWSSSIGEPAAPARAIGIIRDEHRSLAAVMHAWMHALAGAREAGAAADPALMRGDRPLRARSSRSSCTIPRKRSICSARLRERTDELPRRARRARAPARARPPARRGARARRSRRWRRRRRRARARDARARGSGDPLRRFPVGPPGPRGRGHPACGAALPAAEDWAAIDAAFAENRDPNFDGDADREYRQLFSRIVNLTPA